MKLIFTIVILILSTVSYSQQQKLQGKWILDFVKHADGSAFPFNHNYYSVFMSYSFYGDQMLINERMLLVTIDKKSIVSDMRKINFRFEDSYLLLQDQGDNTIMYFLKVEDFVAKYPEFQAQKMIFENKEVFEANEVIKPDFINPLPFSHYVLSKSRISNTQSFEGDFKAKFIVSKKNVLTNIVIVNGISKAFDQEFSRILKNSQQYFSNDTGKDLIVSYEKTYLKKWPKKTKVQEEIELSLRTANKYYDNNDFLKVIEVHQELKLNNKPEVIKQMYRTNKLANVSLGVAYLATNNPEKACQIFEEMGGKTNFNVRNYIVNFCQ